MAAHQAPQSLGFSRQEHWSGLPYHPQNSPVFLSYLPPPQAHHYSNVYLEKLVLFVLERHVNGITHMYC